MHSLINELQSCAEWDADKTDDNFDDDYAKVIEGVLKIVRPDIEEED